MERSPVPRKELIKQAWNFYSLTLIDKAGVLCQNCMVWLMLNINLLGMFPSGSLKFCFLPDKRELTKVPLHAPPPHSWVSCVPLELTLHSVSLAAEECWVHHEALRTQQGKDSCKLTPHLLQTSLHVHFSFAESFTIINLSHKTKMWRPESFGWTPNLEVVLETTEIYL